MPSRTVKIVAVAAFVIPIVMMVLFIRTLLAPVNLQEKLEAVKAASVAYDRHDREITTLYGQGQVWVPLPKMPLFLRRAVVATEDVRFYRHHGFDLRGLARALYEDLHAGRIVQGGSTITQQLAKISLLSMQRTLWRKVEDLAYAIRIERQYSKDQILEFYLNLLYLGHGAAGVEAAAQTYFGRHVGQLNRRESALIAGLIRGPGYYSPFSHLAAAKARANTVIDLMVKAKYLSAAEAAKVKAEPLRILASPGEAYPGGYFIASIIADLRQRFGWSEDYIRRAGLQIHTTMDVDQQRAAEDVIRLLPVGYKDSNGTSQPQGALVALEPATGAVRVLVGGRNYLTSPLNRAIASRRQPGSAIKPFAYAAAMEMGYTPTVMFVDEPMDFWVNGQPWRPKNNDKKYRGPIPLRQALEESVNTVAVQLVQDIGPRAVYSLARKMGLNSLVGSGTRNDVGLAPLALGGLTRGVTPLELTTAYAAFANGGNRVRPFFYTSIEDQHGKVIATDGPSFQQVISNQSAYLMTDMMRGVIQRGTGTRASIGRPAAGKTGTTTDYTNGWFIGYTPQLVAGVWIGNDSGGKPMKVKAGNLGSGMAATLWGNFMVRALAEEPPLDFQTPWSASVPAASSLAPKPAAAPAKPQSSSWLGTWLRRLRELAGG